MRISWKMVELSLAHTDKTRKVYLSTQFIQTVPNPDESFRFSQELFARISAAFKKDADCSIFVLTSVSVASPREMLPSPLIDAMEEEALAKQKRLLDSDVDINLGPEDPKER